MTLVTNGELTDKGKQVFAYMDALIDKTDKVNFNTLPGTVKSYLANVRKLGTMTPVQFAESYPSQLGVIHENLLMETEQQQQAETVTATATKADTVANELESLKAALAEAVNTLNIQAAEIKALKEARVTITVDSDTDDEPEVKPRKRGRKAADATEEPEREEGEPTADSEG